MWPGSFVHGSLWTTPMHSLTTINTINLSIAAHEYGCLFISYCSFSLSHRSQTYLKTPFLFKRVNIIPLHCLMCQGQKYTRIYDSTTLSQIQRRPIGIALGPPKIAGTQSTSEPTGPQTMCSTLRFVPQTAWLVSPLPKSFFWGHRSCRSVNATYKAEEFHAWGVVLHQRGDGNR